MGVTINLYFIKDSGKELDFDFILSKLGVESKPDKKGLSYQQLLSDLWNRNKTPLIGLSYFNNHFIIQDDYSLINQNFEAITKDLQTTVLQIDNSDTVEIGSFSYYENGKCLRRKSYGNDYWVNEIQEAELEIPHGAVTGDFDEGEPLEFERNGSSPFTVLETYGIAFDSLYELDWELRRIED